MNRVGERKQTGVSARAAVIARPSPSPWRGNHDGQGGVSVDDCYGKRVLWMEPGPRQQANLLFVENALPAINALKPFHEIAQTPGLLKAICRLVPEHERLGMEAHFQAASMVFLAATQPETEQV